MNTLSLFDGNGTAYQSLKDIGIHPDNYYASEKDKYAIEISKKNHPDIKHLGNINNWKKWNLPKIHLLIGGSPCQGFSFCGKGLAFEDERSKLFFKYVECLRAFKPGYFLLENVNMKQEYQDVISDLLGVKPVMINSALLTAQNRKRLYWTNITGIQQPDDKGILLKDIIHDGFINRDKSLCLTKSYSNTDITDYAKSRRQIILCKQVGLADGIKGFEQIRRVYSPEGKCPTLVAANGGNTEPKVSTGQVNDNNRVKGITEDTTGYRPHQGDKRKSGIGELGRIHKVNTKTYTLLASHVPKLALNSDINNLTWRKLTAIECERLQGLPDDYTEGVSNSQRYKMLGNGFTAPVISHILKNMTIIKKVPKYNFLKKELKYDFLH